MKLKVGLIYGGDSFEHEISKLTAQSILENIDSDRFEVKKVYLLKNSKQVPIIPLNIDVAFLAVHGPNCEDGKLQELLEIKKIKYTGSGVKASALNMDKIKMHEAFQREGLPIADFLPFNKWDSDNQIIAETEAKIGYPCFIKPNNAGSSVGVSKAKNIHELRQGILRAFKFDEKIIIEKAIPSAKDVEVGVLGNSQLTISKPGLISYQSDFYTYDAKYSNPEISIKFDVFPSEVEKKIKKMTEIAYVATGCSGYARVDFLISNSGQVFINEINTLPGFTATSMYPQLMRTVGTEYKNLITKIIELSL